MNVNSIIVRYGEISLKGKNRIRFERLLMANLEAYLNRQNIEYRRVVLKKGRIFIRGIDRLPRLENVLGVHSYSPALEIEKSMETLKESVLQIVPRIRGAKSFRVSCQRTDKRFKINSLEIERVIGEILLQQSQTPVNLNNPGIHCYIEVGEDHIYLFTRKIRGYGGFPYGVSGRLVSLISGGIDSPVATFLMMKRGVEPVLVHFKVSQSELDKVLKLKEKLESFSSGKEIELHIVDRDDLFQGKFQRFYDDSRFHSYMCILCKFLMHRKAGEIAREEKAWGLITGDNLAQVASQTLKNLFSYQTTSGLPVYSPLIGFEKQDTIDLARKIGTYDISVLKSAGCTPPMTPKTGVSKRIFQNVLKESGLE
jgi:thiamine biosynthesis protein ThiI